MISLRKIIGLPVVRDGNPLGFVERAVLSESAMRLRGLILRRGLGAAKWVTRAQIELIGHRCVVLRSEPARLPRNVDETMGCCYGTAGECLGLVTDAMLLEGTLQVAALEICDGPFFAIAGRKRYAVEYHARPLRKARNTREIVATRLMTWEEWMEGRRTEHERSESGADWRNRLCDWRGRYDDARKSEVEEANAEKSGTHEADGQAVVIPVPCVGTHREQT